jgi:hypothetical protein
MLLARFRLAALSVFAAGVASGSALAQAPMLEPAPPGVEAGELSRRAARALAGERTWLEAVLSVREHAMAAPSEVVFRAWYERGSRRSFLRVIAPEGRAGTGLLRLPPVVWRYTPTGALIEAVESAALREPWLASDFALADLLDPPAGLGTSRARLLGVDPGAGSDGAGRAYVLELRPPPGAQAGRVIAWIDADDATPLRCERRDADDALVATLRFDDVREVAGRRVPHRWTLTQPSAPGRESRVELREIRFEPAFDDAIFTTHQLVQSGRSAAGAPDARLAAPGGSSP